ncbi:flagellar basal body-associated FliL family protein [Ningiella sp. W23]|uniref:flagellar basal body-associated FliL family protein n=1 Tax=Ningiella sp. W23 TaxID=3023715 RepID=UPI0037575ADC
MKELSGLLIHRKIDASWRNASRWCGVYMLILSAMLFRTDIVNAQEEPNDGAPSIAYIAIEPDIVTNYAGNNTENLGFVRVTIEMMLEDPSLIPNLEHHMPLLRATAIEIIGAQPEQKVRSLTGREEMRRMLLKRFRDLMLRESGNETVRDVIFTKYLRQGS